MAMSGPSTTDKPINIEAWAKWFNFRTFGDKQLVSMLEAAAQMVLEIKENKPPRWLTFAGKSGVGKTYLAKKIYRWAWPRFSTSTIGGEISYPHEFIYWPREAQLLQSNKESEETFSAPRAKFLVIDELGGVRDSTGFVTNRLSVILGQRIGKWTIITSNLSLADISEKIDNRVASRIIRDGNKMVEVDVMDYALRRQ